MSFDFSATGRAAREQITVPEIPMESIRSRSHALRARGRVQALAACAAISVGAIGAGTGLGVKIYDGVHVWLSGGKAAMAVQTFVMVREPTAADVRKAIAHATFPVVFPVGMPVGSRVFGIEATPAGRPSAIIIAYRNTGGAEGATFVLLDPAVVDAQGAAARTAAARFGRVDDWRIGGEIVLVASHRLPPSDLERIKAAMLTSSPSVSLAATEAIAPKVVIVGGHDRLDRAERLRPPNGSTVLVDQGTVRSITLGGKSGQAILDRRVFRATKVPYANGEMDYRNVKGVPSKAIAVTANGVRAIAAVLRSTGAGRHGNDCGCEVLFSQPNGTTYWIWTMPASAAGPVKKYSVDARTLVVTPA